MDTEFAWQRTTATTVFWTDLGQKWCTMGAGPAIGNGRATANKRARADGRGVTVRGVTLRGDTVRGVTVRGVTLRGDTVRGVTAGILVRTFGIEKAATLARRDGDARRLARQHPSAVSWRAPTGPHGNHEVAKFKGRHFASLLVVSPSERTIKKIWTGSRGDEDDASQLSAGR
jgi:hypothetical protein